MKKHIIILLFCIININAFAQSTLSKSIDFTANNITINEALLKLSKIAETDIAFSNNFFKNQTKINLDFQGETIDNILDEILASTNIDYKQMGNRILLFKKKIQYYTISGYIEDEATGERLISATVYSPELQKGTETNEYGFYSLTLPKGAISLIYSYLGCEQQETEIDLNKSLQKNIQLKNSLTLAAVIVNPTKQKEQIFQTQDEHYATQISTKMTAIIPDLGGEADPIRTAQMMPGIQSGADGLGGIYVRGGDSGHNLMLLDGVTVYIPYHLLGIFSIYNNNTIRSAKVLKGSFPARYGGRLASVFDVRTREGNQYKWTGQGGINLINSNALIEGPFQNGKGAVLLAGRVTHSDFLLKPFFQKTYFRRNAEELETGFYDFNVKMNYTLSEKDRLYLSVYRGADIMQSSSEYEDEDDEIFEEDEIQLNWSNSIAALRWNHLYNDKLFSNTTLMYSIFNYEYTVLEEIKSNRGERPEEILYIDNRSTNGDFGLKTDFDFLPSAVHRLRFGAGISFRQFVPDITFFDELDEELDDFDDDFRIDDFDELIEGKLTRATESYAYFEDQINLHNKWRFDIGLRASAFLQDEQTYANLEPRLVANYKINPSIGLHTSLSRMVQYLHLVSNSTVRLPNDLWVPSDEDILPEEAWQTELGLSINPSSQTHFTIDAYYKWMENLYSYPDFYDFKEDDFETDDFGEFLVAGNGEAFGVEFSLKHDSEKMGGYLSYAFTESTRQFEKINLEQPFPHAYDQPHQVKIFLYRKFGERFHAGLNWVFNTANPIQFIQPLGSEQVNPNIETGSLSGNKNVQRSENYHRLDLSLTYKLVRPKAEHTIKLGAYNAYNRANIAYYRVDVLNANSMPTIRPVYALPFRPSIAYSIRF